MKKLLYIILVCIIVSSCTVISGINYDNSKKAKSLQIGMSKDEAITIMGKNYIIESASQEEDGLLEIIKYYTTTDVPYLLHFLNGKLIVFNRYYPPHVPEQKITINKEKE